MKRILIGGFLAIVSTLWALVLGAYVQCNLVSEWYANRFWASAVELGVVVPLIVALAVLALSIVSMCIEYFRKNQ